MHADAGVADGNAAVSETSDAIVSRSERRLSDGDGCQDEEFSHWQDAVEEWSVWAAPAGDAEPLVTPAPISETFQSTFVETLPQSEPALVRPAPGVVSPPDSAEPGDVVVAHAGDVPLPGPPSPVWDDRPIGEVGADGGYTEPNSRADDSPYVSQDRSYSTRLEPAFEAEVVAPLPAGRIRDQMAGQAPAQNAPQRLPRAASARTDYRVLAKQALRITALLAGGYLCLVLALIVIYRFVNPPVSNLMIYEGLFGAGARQEWVPLEKISPYLVQAVVMAEDARFCQHSGIDLISMKEAIERAGHGVPRGASTISMQLTKNLFLWQAKSYLRKIIELPLTLIIELVWPKWRILEIYLNVAEWGPGIFGAEAAARHHFDRSAASLSAREAAQLAAALPNPIRRDAGSPGPKVARKASIIQKRVRSSGNVAFCVRSAHKR